MASSAPTLKAAYSSPINPAFTHTAELPSLGANNVSERVTYLAALRKETAALQERINAELTQRMEDGKAQAATDAAGNNKRKVDDVAEEENYGEEVVEED